MDVHGYYPCNILLHHVNTFCDENNTRQLINQHTILKYTQPTEELTF